tara:strand:- start:2754 stop:2972 length:219 start_codon:yes stop_codon:yes gene_type:complete
MEQETYKIVQEVDGWKYGGRISKNNGIVRDLHGYTFEELCQRTLKSDHGEERRTTKRSDGGVDCWWREKDES